MLYCDEVEMLEEKLHPFHFDTTVYVVASSLTLPGSDRHKLIDITRGNSTKVTPLNKSEVAYTESNPLTKATLKRSVFVREDDNSLTIYPAASSSTWNTDTNSSGSVDAESFEVSYYKKPPTPNWAYIVTGEKALYNSNGSTDFLLHVSEEENLVSRILMLAGVTIQKPDVQQAGIQDIQLIKQQQNS